MVVVEVVAMPLGRIQAAARLSNDLQHSQHFFGTVVRSSEKSCGCLDRRSICCSRRRKTDAQASGWAKPVLDQPHDNR